MAAEAGAAAPGISALAAALYDPALHDKYLNDHMKRLASELAAMVAGLPDCKQRRVAFEKYVTRCLARTLYGSETGGAAESLEDPFTAVEDGDAAMALAALDKHEGLLAQRDALLHDVRASRPAADEMDDQALLDALSAEEDPRLDELLVLTLRANQAHKAVAALTCAGWPRGAWASVCEGAVLGPFATREEAAVHINMVPRSCFGALSWQVGVPVVPLEI